jgi:hypothetical protein
VTCAYTTQEGDIRRMLQPLRGQGCAHAPGRYLFKILPTTTT